MAVNSKSLKNLKPYQKGVYSPNRQIGRKRGSFNKNTIFRQMLESSVDLNSLVGDRAKMIGEKASGKTYYEAIIMALINGALNLDVKSANTLLKQLDKIDLADKRLPLEKENRIEITVVNSSEELQKINEAERRLLQNSDED